MSATKPIYRLDDIDVDPLRGSLTRGGTELYLRQQAFQVLLYLLDERQRLVTKEELIHGIWRDTVITDKALTQCVADISKVLGDDVHHPRFIRTFPKIGYRFIGHVEERFVGDLQPGKSPAPSRTKNNVPVSESRPFINSTEYLAFIPGQPRLAESVSQSTVSSKIAAKLRISKKVVLITVLAILLIAAPIVAWQLARSYSRTPLITMPAAAGKKSMIVMFFQTQSGATNLNWMRDGLPELLISDLGRSDKLSILSRPQLYSLFNETGHKATDNLGLGDALNIASQSHAQVAVVGTINRQPDKQIIITARLYDVASGVMTAEELLTARDENEIPTQVNLLASKLADHLSITLPGAADRNTSEGDPTANNNATQFYSLGLSKAQAGENEKAVELLKRAVQQDPNSALAYAWIGYAYAINGSQPEEAQPYLDKALNLRNSLSPKDRLTVTGWSQIAHKDYAGAIKTFRQMVAVYPGQTDGYERLGMLLLGEEQPGEAINVLKQGLALSSQAENLYSALCAVYLTTGRYDDAVEAGRHSVEFAANEAKAHDTLGRALQKKGQYDEAAAEYKKALGLDPDYENANLHLGDLYFQQGQFTKAALQYQSYVDNADSDFARAIGWGRLADLYIRKGDLGKADETARTEVRLNNGSVWHSLIIALEKSDKDEVAKLQPTLFASLPYPQPGASKDQRSSYYYRGYIALKNGQRNDAINNFKSALHHLPSVLDMDTHEDCLGRAYLEIGKADEAINEFNRILQLDSNYPLAHFYLAQALDLKGDKDRATNEYSAFMQLWKNADPDLPEVVSAKQRLSNSN